MVKLLDPELVENGEETQGGQTSRPPSKQAVPVVSEAATSFGVGGSESRSVSVDSVGGWPPISSSIAALSVVVFAACLSMTQPSASTAAAAGSLVASDPPAGDQLNAALGFPAVAAAFAGQAHADAGGMQPPDRVESEFFQTRLEETLWAPSTAVGHYLLPIDSLGLVGYYRPHGSYAADRLRPMARSADGRRLTMQVDRYEAAYYWTDPFALEEQARQQGEFLGPDWPEGVTGVGVPTPWISVDVQGGTRVHYSEPLHEPCGVGDCPKEFTRVGRVSPRTGAASFHAATVDPTGGLSRQVLGGKRLPDSLPGSLSLEIPAHPLELESSPQMVVRLHDVSGPLRSALCVRVLPTGLELIPVLSDSPD